MRALLFVLFASLLPQMGHADALATGGALDPLTRVLTPCLACGQMESLRQFFVRAHGNKSMVTTDLGQDNMGKVYDNADRLMAMDGVTLRDAHFKDELESYFMLALEAAPYDEATEITHSVAYLNIVIGSSELYTKVMSQIPDGCRKRFLVQAVANQECEERNKSEAIDAVTFKRAAQIQKCQAYPKEVGSCEAKVALRIK